MLIFKKCIEIYFTSNILEVRIFAGTLTVWEGSNGLFALPDSDTNSDSDGKPNGYIVLTKNFSHYKELDSDSNPNCQLQELDQNWDQNRNLDLWI